MQSASNDVLASQHITLFELQQIRERIKRTMCIVQRMAGAGYRQSHVLSDGNTHDYHVRGIKSPSQLEDELLNLFIWVWSMKDYLKESYKASGIDPSSVEKVVDANRELQLISDIANRAKHGNLVKSRSRQFATLVNVGITIPQSSIQNIIVEAFSVKMNVKDTDNVEFRVDIQCSSSGEVLDAFTVLHLGLKAWEQFVVPIVIS